MKNCEKRTVQCWLFDDSGILIAYGRNQCAPVGKCARLDITQSKHNYTGDECNSIHAEVAALDMLRPGDQPKIAIIQGHDFFCNACEDSLRQAGVERFEVIGYDDPRPAMWNMYVVFANHSENLDTASQRLIAKHFWDLVSTSDNEDTNT